MNQELGIMIRLRRITSSILDFVEIISQLFYHNNAPMELKKCQRHEVMVVKKNGLFQSSVGTMLF
jgi:hypothetical protein